MDSTALTLVLIGAINWLLVGLFQLDLVATIFGGSDSWISRIIYILVGIAGIYCIKFYSRVGDTENKRTRVD
ncbi:MAG: DUF378 domain-containing protein [Tissierellia bacterium]|jgi:uncharacterized membrane protein YuzA (DUF378 family)|nr:DUF378 domain-containing protein [Tissierellia bacterium]